MLDKTAPLCRDEVLELQLLDIEKNILFEVISGVEYANGYNSTCVRTTAGWRSLNAKYVQKLKRFEQQRDKIVKSVEDYIGKAIKDYYIDYTTFEMQYSLCN